MLGLITGIIIITLLFVNLELLIDFGIIYVVGAILIELFNIHCTWTFLHAILAYVGIRILKHIFS